MVRTLGSLLPFVPVRSPCVPCSGSAPWSPSSWWRRRRRAVGRERAARVRRHRRGSPRSPGTCATADGYAYDLRDDSGRTMDTAQITQVPDGTYLAVYHSTLADGRFHAAVADLHGSAHLDPAPRLRRGHQPAHARRRRRRRLCPRVRKGSGQPHRRTRLRGSRRPAGRESRPRVRRAPHPLALRRGHAGHHLRARRHGRTHRPLPGGVRHRPPTPRHPQGLHDLARHARPAAGPRPGGLGDRAATWATARPSNSRADELVSDRGSAVARDFGSWRTYAYDPMTGRADRLTVRTHGGSRAFANPSATLLTDPDGHPALLVSLFVPRRGRGAGGVGPTRLLARIVTLGVLRCDSDVTGA